MPTAYQVYQRVPLMIFLSVMLQLMLILLYAYLTGRGVSVVLCVTPLDIAAFITAIMLLLSGASS